jgi:hypothetical protein
VNIEANPTKIEDVEDFSILFRDNAAQIKTFQTMAQMGDALYFDMIVLTCSRTESMNKLLRPKETPMPQDYTHPDPNDGIRSVSGEYHLEKEGRAMVNGREVLYLVGYGVVDSACCGTGGMRYALVPGYLVAYHARTNDQGRPVSEVEPITDSNARQSVSSFIQLQESIQQVQFL